jgi:hypothetical protein
MRFSVVVYWLVVTLWLVTNLPIAAISLLSLEIPLWPHFVPERTTEGIAVWAALAAWFYMTPLLLWLFRARFRSPK